MPYSITTKDGITINNIPDDVAADSPVLRERVAKIRGGSRADPNARAPSGGFSMGLRDPIDAGAQLLENILPTGVSTAVNKANNWLADQGLPLARVEESGQGGTKQIQAVHKAYDEKRKQAARVEKGLSPGEDVDPGMDWSRVAGNVVNPVNLAAASRLPAAATTLGRVGTGLLGGMVGGALTPTQGDEFWKEKGAQVGIGGVTGAVAAPVLGKITDSVAKAFANRAKPGPINQTEIDRTIREVMSESGTRFEDLSGQMQDALRKQVIEATGAGRRLDTAAMLRKQDFAAEGIPATLGQIGRDARQYATERNLRTMPGVGDPLLTRFEQQGKMLQGKVGNLAEGASDRVAAGEKLSGALKAYDDKLSKGVSAAYRAARDSAGKDAEVPLAGLAGDYANVLDSFGDKIPSGVRNQFEKFGLSPDTVGNAKKLFTVEEADKLIKVINDNVGSDRATNTALSQLRNAVKTSVTKDAGADDVFAPARKAAAERFRLQEVVPALEASASGSTAPDDFVRRYVISGKANDVKAMADILRKESPEALQEARAQVGEHLKRAAFGENLAGDKAFAPERYAKALRDLGDRKLEALFSKEEVAQIHRLGRIGAYINSHPNASPVQTSNNWGAIMEVASRIPGVSQGASLIKGAKNVIDNQMSVKSALAAEVPKKTAEIPAEQARLLAKLLSAGGMAAGAGSAGGMQ